MDFPRLMEGAVESMPNIPYSFYRVLPKSHLNGMDCSSLSPCTAKWLLAGENGFFFAKLMKEYIAGL